MRSGSTLSIDVNVHFLYCKRVFLSKIYRNFSLKLIKIGNCHSSSCMDAITCMPVSGVNTTCAVVTRSPNATHKSTAWHKILPCIVRLATNEFFMFCRNYFVVKTFLPWFWPCLSQVMGSHDWNQHNRLSLHDANLQATILRSTNISRC